MRKWKKVLRRIKCCGLYGTVRKTQFFLLQFLRNSTPQKMINFGLAKIGKTLRWDRVRNMPYRYTIDPINLCNLRCPLCPTGLGILKRPRGRMRLEDFKRLIDEIAPWAYLVDLYNWGEPFLHPDIFEMIRYACESRIVVRLSSNLNHFDRQMAIQTVQSGLHCIVVSIDGATEETYQRYRRHGSLEVVLRNLRYLAEARKSCDADKPLIIVRMLVNRYNEKEIQTLRQMVLGVGADLFAVGDLFIDTFSAEQRKEWLPANPVYSSYQYTNIQNTWHCSDLWESMTVNWDGGVVPCCWIHNAAYDFGNVFESSVYDIWNGDSYVTARRSLSHKNPIANFRKVICTECQGHPHYLEI